MTEDLEVRFTYHAPKDGQGQKYVTLRDTGKSLAQLIDDLCPDSREKSIAVTKIEEAIFWANASIARREL